MSLPPSVRYRRWPTVPASERLPDTWAPVLLYWDTEIDPQKSAFSPFYQTSPDSIVHHMHAFEFADIRIRAALPLHPYLSKHSHLFLRLVADGSVCGDTVSVNGDLASGVWEFNARLYAPRVKQSLNIAVLTGVKGPGVPVVSVTLKVPELLERLKAFPTGHYNVDIFDSGTPIQLKLVMTCSIKLLSILNAVSNAAGDKGRTVNRVSKNDQSDLDPAKIDLSSREDLEALYTMIARRSDPDEDESQARMLSELGHAYHTLYGNEHGKADLEKAISMQEDAMQFTGLFHPDLVELAGRFAMALSERFQQSGDRVDIERAVSFSQTAVRFTEDLDATKPFRLGTLGNTLLLRFQYYGDLVDLENSIRCQRETLRGMPDDHPDKPGAFNNLGNALKYRFEHLGVLADLEDSLSNYRRALELTPVGHPNKPGRFHSVGHALLFRFERLNGLPDLEDAISNHQHAVQLAQEDHPDNSTLFTGLGIALQSRFARLGSITDLEDAISNHRQAIPLTPDGHYDKPVRFNNLGVALQSRFARLGDLTDLEDAISNLRQAVQFAPDGHPDNPTLFTSLGSMLQFRFERLDVPQDLEDAISNLQQAVQLTPDGHYGKPGRFNYLGLALRTRFERLGGLTDLEDAISNLRRAAQSTPDGHPDNSTLFSNLGIALQSRFARLGSITDLEDAISNHRQAIQLTPDSHRQLNNLGNALRSHFDRLGILQDLEDAISNLRQAVQFAPDGHPDIPTLFSNLGIALQSRFECLGSITDLEDAIPSFRQAVQLTPDSHPDKPSRFNNLGLALQSRFTRLGGLTDLEDAVSNLRQAVQFAPDGHPDNLPLLSNLGIALKSRFERLGSITDLEDAISNHRQAVQLTPDSHPDKPGRFKNLGNALLSHFECLDAPRDLEDAISNLQQAVQFTPDGHPDNPTLFNNLGIALHSRFVRLGVLIDLEDAISNLQQAVQLTPDGHPEKPPRLRDLGVAFETRFRCLGILSDLESALSSFSTAANSVIGSAMVRFNAARTWAKLTEEQSRSPLDAFDCAINLLPQIAWLGLAVADQHALLAYGGGIVCDAVAAAIRYGQYETAVVWAEQGRSIVWQNLLGLRSPVENLRETHPELVGRLRSVAKHLGGSGSHLEAPMASAGDVSLNYSKLAIEWDDIVEEVRGIPGFEGFLKAKSFRQLAPAAHEGPVVILNVNEAQCDALVLISDDSVERKVSAVHIPLERFSYEKSKRMFQTLTELLLSAGVRKRSDRKTGRVQSQVDGETKFKVILGILWEDIAKPVIEALAFHIEPKRPPRIWWCPTGLFAFLPIHAAGLYDTPEVGERLSDYVISSYTPTLTTILTPSDKVVQGDFQILTVAQASAPGAPPIPKTEDEVRIIQGLTTSVRVLNLTEENATVERVRKGMMESNWIHLACHGKQNPDDPMESGFLLHDNILKLSEIVRMSLPKADFAFLSACQTAMGDEKVAEESAHLAAGMLLSGCRGVIATTWSIRDEDGPKIVEDVYGRIFKDGKPNRKEAAYALHEAVKRLRESGAKCTSWVPFIHIGR